MEELIIYYSLKYEGDFKKIYEALLQKEEINERLKEELFKKIKCKYTTIFNDDYPESLKTIDCPPFVLYYYGDLSLLNKNTIGVVGMRKPSEYGIEVTKSIVTQLVQNDYTIVSGMVRGIDEIAHQECINKNGHTIAVLGCGIEKCYSLKYQQLYEEIKKNHLLISECPYLTEPKQQMFPFRNRIIAGLSKSILVTETNEKGGTMDTVRYALEQGKEVFAIPSRVFDNIGCNVLIQHGANLVLNIYDIIEKE